MAHFLRDQMISNISVTEENLTQLSSLFLERVRTLNATILDSEILDKTAILTFIIRFDNKGYRVYSIEDVLTYFRQAKSIERVLLTIETAESLRTNRAIGTVMELRFDGKDQSSSFLVTSDDKDWVDASFSAVQETLSKYQNWNRWARSAWTIFGVQIVGVTLGFLLSIWAAAKIAPKLAIENAFIITFLFSLLIFSNTWTYLNQLVLRLIDAAFPNVKFFRRDKDRLHWLLQAIVGGIVGAAVLYVIGQAAAFLLELLSTLVSKNS